MTTPPPPNPWWRGFVAGFPYTWIGFLNFLILQFLGMRLVRISVINDRGIEVHREHHVFGWVLPFTGWWGLYVCFGPEWMWPPLPQAPPTESSKAA